MNLTKQEIVIPNIFQKEALEKLEETDKNRGIIVMPTGTGKTFLAVLWYIKILEQNPDAKLLYICHNKDILSQANEKEFQKNLINFNISYGEYNCYEKNIQQVTFGTVQTLYRNLRKFKKDFFDYIIVDEAHHYQARTFKKVIKYFTPNFLLGLTATPNRKDNKSIFEICGDIVYNATIYDGIKNKLLTKIKYFSVDNDIDFSNVKWNGNNYDEKDLNRLLCVKEYDESIIKEFMKDAKENHKRKRTICFCATIEHAYRLKNLFNKNGINAIALVGKTEKNYKTSLCKTDRKEAINGFKSGKYEIIFVRDMFNEGIDVPEADCIMMLRPTQSDTIFTQQLGRGLRKSEGKDYVLILDFTGNCKKCTINYRVLSGIVGEDILYRISKTHKRRTNIVFVNNGCEVYLTKKKINILKQALKQGTLITKEMLIKDYRIIKAKYVLSKVPTTDDIIAHSKYSLNQYYAHFGTWRNFKIQMGDCIDITKEKVIEDYNKFKEEHERPLLAKEAGDAKIFGYTFVRAVKRLFQVKTFCDFLKLVGDWDLHMKYIKETQGKKDIEFTKEKVIKEYNKVNEELGRHVKWNEFESKEGLPSRSTINNLFGGINKFREAINPNIKITYKYTPKTIISKVNLRRKIKVGGRIEGWGRKNYKSTETKNLIREKIIAKINDGDKVLLLESPELSALKEIERQGKKPSKVVIPNHIEFKKLAQSIQNYKTNLNIEIINCSVLQYLIDSDEKFDFIWLDYCGAFSYYMKDLDVLFMKKFENIKLILTYNLFDIEKQDNGYYFTRVIDYVLERSSGNKVRLINDITYRYKKNMYNLGFEIRH